MFASSNFFWENLEKIAYAFEELKMTHPIMESFFYIPVISSTSVTTTGDFFYTSNTTNIPETLPQNLKLYSAATNVSYTGATSNL